MLLIRNDRYCDNNFFFFRKLRDLLAGFFNYLIILTHLFTLFIVKKFTPVSSKHEKLNLSLLTIFVKNGNFLNKNIYLINSKRAAVVLLSKS